MEPPTCTVLVRLVRTTAVLATELLPPDDVATLLLLPVDALATPPPPAPPTRAPAMAAMAATRRAEISAIGDRDRSSAVGPRPAGRRSTGSIEVRHSDDAWCLRARGVVRRAGLLGAHLVGVLEGWTVRVDAGPLEVSVAVRRGVGVIRHPIGSHTIDIRRFLGCARRLWDRLAAPQCGLGRQQVIAARTDASVNFTRQCS